MPIDDACNIISFRSFSRSVSVEVFHYKGGKFEEAYKFHNQIINLLCTKVKYFHNDSEGQNLKKNNQRSIPTPKIKKSPGTKAFDFSIEHYFFFSQYSIPSTFPAILHKLQHWNQTSAINAQVTACILHYLKTKTQNFTSAHHI